MESEKFLKRKTIEQAVRQLRDSANQDKDVYCLFQRLNMCCPALFKTTEVKVYEINKFNKLVLCSGLPYDKIKRFIIKW